jgi:2-oxoisovalerate dehydrogenase E1 component
VKRVKKYKAPEPSAAELTQAYTVGSRNRSMDERIVRLVSQGVVKFAIYGPGQEAHATACALAWHKALGGDTKRFGFCGHYRSGTLYAMWAELTGRHGFVKDVLRQQYSRATDPFSAGRNMVNHLLDMDRGLLPIQSPLGMNLGKAAGYSKAMILSGVKDGFVCAAIGDGTTAEGDLHDTMNAISVWDLPMCVMVTDNNIAISTRPEEGRGVKDLKAYAKAFNLAYFESKGWDFWDCYETAYAVARHCSETQSGAVWHVREMPRLNGHSSAGNYRFDMSQRDPILLMGERLVEMGVLEQEDICTRHDRGEGADYFAHHDLGKIMGAEDAQVAAWQAEVLEEPHPDPNDLGSYTRPPFPAASDPSDLMERSTTNVTYAGALRASFRDILSQRTGAIWGEDVAELGGVMQATAGIHDLHPDNIIDAPINEPMIVGTAVGAGLYPGFVAMPEIQFGDYSLNAYHWLVHMGNLSWGSIGQAVPSVILRMPSDPFGGGAMYHSMSLDGMFSSIPGLVILMPSTSYDAYGLMMSAADYGGPVIVLEPKYCYRRSHGPSFPGEPTDKDEIKKLKNLIRKGGIPEIGEGVRVPLGKGIIRHPGTDLTLVGWGRGAIYGEEVAQTLAEEGISIEVIDLRTIVPPDMDLIFESVAKTGKLVVAADDRTFGGFHREIQSQVVEAMPGVLVKAVGMKNVVAIAQSEHLEEATAINPERIQAAIRGLLTTGSSNSTNSPTGWNWIPSRYFVG